MCLIVQISMSAKYNINHDIPSNENVKLSLINTIEQKIKHINLGNTSGTKNITFDVSNLSKELYFVNISIGSEKYSKPIQINYHIIKRIDNIHL